MTVPAPVPSPEHTDLVSDHPSGSYKTATIANAVAIAEQAVIPVAKATRWQWLGLGLLGALTVGTGAFLGWCLITMGVLNSAQAQTRATAEVALETAKTSTIRVEAVDSGTRASIENLRKEVAEDRAATNRKLDDMQITLTQILRKK